MDSVHEPSHPALLDWLTEDFITSRYDIRRLVAALARSSAYQLSSIQPDGIDDPATFAWYLERPLTAEQLARSVQVVVRGEPIGDDSFVGLFRQQFQDVLPDQNIVTVRDALFLSNSTELDQFLRDSQGPQDLIPRLTDMEDHSPRIDVLIHTAFGRPATIDERQVLVEYLEQRPGALESALTQIVWSLLTSAEFRFNH